MAHISLLEKTRQEPHRAQPVESSLQFVPKPVTGENRAGAKRRQRKRQPQERQHSADADTAAGRGTDCSRETG